MNGILFLGMTLPGLFGQAGDPLEGAADRIEKNRRGNAVILVERDEEPLPGARVVIEQTRHAFLFGANAFRLRPAGDDGPMKLYKERFKALFNHATLAFHWASYEKERGKPNEDRLRAMAEWCLSNGIEPKGHPVLWHGEFPKWIGEEEDIELVLQKRVQDTVGRFKGLIDRWDVMNESLDSFGNNNAYGRWFKRNGLSEATEKGLRWAAEANAGGAFLVNEYRTDPTHKKQLAELVERKAPLHAIGIQSGMQSGPWALPRVWKVCEGYAKYGLPIHFTEMIVLSGHQQKNAKTGRSEWPSTPEDEQKQAEYAEKLYTLLFSHPSVESVTWWDLADGGLSESPGGLLRRNMSPKPAYDRLMALIKDAWWTRRAEAVTGDDGCARLRGFYGTYTCTVTPPAGTPKTVTFELKKGVKDAIRVGM